MRMTRISRTGVLAAALAFAGCVTQPVAPPASQALPDERVAIVKIDPSAPSYLRMMAIHDLEGRFALPLAYVQSQRKVRLEPGTYKVQVKVPSARGTPEYLALTVRAEAGTTYLINGGSVMDRSAVGAHVRPVPTHTDTTP